VVYNSINTLHDDSHLILIYNTRERLPILFSISSLMTRPLLSKLACEDTGTITKFFCAQTMDKSLATISIFLYASNLRPYLIPM
jgi:hypothetical protein